MKRNDSGYILPMTLVTITLMAFAALLTGRTFGVQLRASIQERFIIEERLTARNAEHILDAWMADPKLSAAITGPDQEGAGMLRTPDGSLGCSPPANETCWNFSIAPAPPSPPKLRGGEAILDTRVITVEIGSDCFGATLDQCRRTTPITRTYERAVFSQYQLHYHSHDVPPGAIGDAERELTNAVAAANPSLTASQVDARVDELTADPPVVFSGDTDVIYWVDLISLLGTPDLEVVFADGDTFNGPVRYSGSGTIQYCSKSPGDVQFRRLEIKDAGPPANLCSDQDAYNYQWCTDNTCNIPAAWNDPTHADRLEDGKGDKLEFLPWSLDDEPTPDMTCAEIDTIGLTDGCGSGIADGYVIRDPSDPSNRCDLSSNPCNITITNLRLTNKSISVFARGDIIVTADTISTTGSNPAGGAHAIALIAGGNIILDPSLGLIGVTFRNVAILARDGAVFARDWHQECVGSCPTFTLEGSAAMHHLGLYGRVGPPQTGWEKDFTYPPDFWRARPPWWPDFDGKEWAPA